MRLKNVKMFMLGAVMGASVFAAFSFADNDNSAPLTVLKNGRIQYKWYPPATPSKMSFAGEKVPLSRPEVKERLEYEMLVNSYAHSHVLQILKLSTRVFPTLEKKLKANGIPEDFKYVCVAESSLGNPTSRAGAVGYWQFMTATGKEYGLEINSEVDRRYDLDAATDAACAYLKKAYERFGNWTAAAASYNCGMGGFSRQSSFQMSDNYYDLQLPEETNRYIFRILALKEIIGNPEKYGYHVPEPDRYRPIETRSVTVTNSIDNLAAFARQHGTNYKMIRLLNPWLRSGSLTISRGNQYEIKLPAEG